MSYHVLARKWRPQRFDDVVGQQAVTRTLRNALVSGRVAHAFVFAGPRGVGKTTTARILARALNCIDGPTPDPCGECDACREIAEGRDIDVLEIDAATHTQVENIREVIIAGLAIAPVRNRFKVFLIDEVHQLSGSSFNALLKSIEEPPPHVVFMMATTEIGKIPDTVLSRSQVFELRTISARAIAEQLGKIATAEQVAVSDEALAVIARSAEGSMRDAQSALDQVIAFAGGMVSIEDVSTVLGLVGRDLLIDMVTAVANEDLPAAFDLTGRAVEAGHDLRLVCRELSRVVRDLLLLAVDPARVADPEVAPEGERDRLTALSRQFSREDLLRAFDVLSRAEADIRYAAQPRYHLEMALLRWIHLRKLVPLSDLIDKLQTGVLPTGRSATPRPPSPEPASARTPEDRPAPAAAVPAPSPGAPVVPEPSGLPAEARRVKDALLAEIRAAKAVFYNTVVAQARTIEVDDTRVTFTFTSAHRALRDQVERLRPWLESLAERVAGRKLTVVAAHAAEAARPQAGAASEGSVPEPSSAARKSDLKAEALADQGVQAMLEVFPAEIRDVEEM